jgi:acyl-CoA reductase-like NAD-dependent aldehyde dehydrogenase
VSERHLKRVLSYVSDARADGAEVITGGERANMRGYFFTPTVIRTQANDLSICQDEVFGPVLVVQETRSVEEMLALANDTRYGLSAAVWTRDVARGHLLAREIRSGSVWINTAGAGDPCFPCGGVKQSGWGRERGREGIDAYLQTKSIACAL